MKPGGWLTLLLLACVARLWLMPLPSSFWLDELATVFVVRHGAGDPSLAVAAPQAWKSVYYYLPRAAEVLFGFSEITYRLPSLLAMALALLLVARLAARLIHPQAAWFAAFACLALRGINYEAADARPYALGMCVAAASLLFLVRWMDSARWSDALLFVVFAGLLWRVHLLFWPMYVAFVLYVLVSARVNWLQAGIAFGLLALALLPVLMDALSLYRDARAHVFAPPPTFRQLAASLHWPLILACAAGALCRRRPLARASLVLIVGWWLCQPLCLFAFSRLTANSVFVPRYLALSLPGAALAATLAASLWIPPRAWKPLAAVLGLGALIWLGQWRSLWPLHHNSDWRAAAHKVNEVSAGVVICPSPFVEAMPPVWRPGYPLSGFLYAQLSAYPIAPTEVSAGPEGTPAGVPAPRPMIYGFPFADSPEAEQFAARLAADDLDRAGRFVIYGWEPQVHFWTDWFRARPEMAGWQVRHLGPFADVDVVVFERVNGIMENWRFDFGKHHAVARTGKEPMAGRGSPL